MKRILLIGVMGTAILCAAEPEVVSLGDLTEETLENFTKGKQQNVVVECPAGMVLPLTLSLQGEFLALESRGETAAHVKILKTCFMKCINETFFFSLDRKSWKEFSEFFTGKLSAEFHNTDKGPFFGVGCELHQK